MPDSSANFSKENTPLACDTPASQKLDTDTSSNNVSTETGCEFSPNTYISTIPEKDSIVWQIEDFEAFRNAAKVAHLPPLVSPEFGGGCQVRLWPFEKEQIRGVIELPPRKWGKDGLTRFKISVLKPNNEAVIVRNIELKVARGKGATRFGHFCLSKREFLNHAKYQHLLFKNGLRIRVEMEYYPFDAIIFKGFPKSTDYCEDDYRSLLSDIEEYCKTDGRQYAVVRCGAKFFPACRFLLSARSLRFRSILECHTLSDTSKPAITIKDCDAETMEQMLSFVHTDKCDFLHSAHTDLTDLTKLFQAADSFQIKSLLQRTGEAICSRLTTDNVLQVWDVAENGSWTPLKDECVKLMDSIPGSQVVEILRQNSPTFGTLTPAQTPRLVTS